MSSSARRTAVHDLVIDQRVDGTRHRLALSGELDLASAGSLSEAVAKACREGAREVVLDIGALEFIDSTGLRAILSSRVVCAESNCALAVSPAAEEVGPQVRRLLQVTGLLERLPFTNAPAKDAGPQTSAEPGAGGQAGESGS